MEGSYYATWNKNGAQNTCTTEISVKFCHALYLVGILGGSKEGGKGGREQQQLRSLLRAPHGTRQ